MFPISSSFGSEDKRILFQCHKETQTNFKNSSNTSPSDGHQTASNEGSVTILEINEILQDPTHPGDVTIIKDVFSEEIHDHGTQTPDSDGRSNRYTYCREVIKPFLKDYPADCPISDEQLIRDALLAAQQDYPDQQPCVDRSVIYDGNSDTKNKKDTVILDKYPNKENPQSSDSKDTNKPSDTCIYKKNSKPDLPDFGIVGTTNPISSNSCSDKDIKSESSSTSAGGKPKKSKRCKKSKRSKERKEKESADSSETNVKDQNINKNVIATDKSSKDSLQSNMSDDEECPRKKRDPKCPKVTRRPSIEDEVFRTGRRASAGPPAICKNPTPTGFSTCKNTPSAEACEDKEDDKKEQSSSKKKKDDNPCSHKMDSGILIIDSSASSFDTKMISKKPLSIADAHPQTMATIKLAVEDFFGKIYQGTKDQLSTAATVVRKESVKQICSFISCEKSDSKCNIPPREVNDDPSEKNPESGRFQFFHDLDGDLKDDPKDGGTSGLSDQVQAVAGSILSKVDSTFSMLSNHVDVTLRSLNETSSPYDKTVEEAAEEAKTEAPGVSMFSSIKSRIISLFGESVPKDN